MCRGCANFPRRASPAQELIALKKAGAISILLLLFYSQFGYYGQFILLQWRMKEAAREARIAALPDRVLERVDAAGVRWAEAGKECWYAGHLYDVIRQRTFNGATWLYCLDDEGEQRLIDGSVGVTKSNQDLPARRNSATVSIGDIICETLNWEIGLPSLIDLQYYPGEDDRVSTRSSDIVIPPPKTPAAFIG